MQRKKNTETRSRGSIASKRQTKVSALNMGSEWIWLFLVVVVSFIAYLPSLNNGFVNWDDGGYVTENPLIKVFNLKNIFSSYQMGNYHPLTIGVYAVQYRFFGTNAAGYHITNLLLHLLNIILVYRLIFLLTGKKEIALFVSLLFGIHPVHVESVAWVSELKDLLYATFFLATAIFYIKYSSTNKRKFYFLSLVLFLFALLSKAMAASLPFALVLIDFYRNRKISGKDILNKLPFFILSIIFGVVAILAQHSSEAFNDIDAFSFQQRIVFACYGIISYFAKLFLPLHLSAFYPYPGSGANNIFSQYFIYVILVILLLAGIFYSLRFTRKIFFGAGFFLATVLLVLQILPVGRAVMADRYAYIPSIGFLYVVAEALVWLWNTNLYSKLKPLWVVLFSAYLIFFAAKTYSQCKVWNDGMTLWANVINESPTAAVAYNNKGYLLMGQGKYDEALSDYNKAIELRPDYPAAINSRGLLFSYINQPDKALRDYNKAIQLKPGFADVFFNKGVLFASQQKYQEALSNYNKAIELKPDFTIAYLNRGGVYFNLKFFSSAISDYTKVIELNNDAQAYYNRGLAKYNTGLKEDALNDLHKAANLGLKQAATALQTLDK